MAKKILIPNYPEIKPEQSIDLLKALHILTADGRMNQDSRRKLKQVYHLYQFIEPLLQELLAQKSKDEDFCVVDHGAGKSYLGFILYDLFFKQRSDGVIFGIETRAQLIDKAKHLANTLRFNRMRFEHAQINEACQSVDIPSKVDMVTALHACDTATDDAITFGLEKKSSYFVVVPCCQAEVSRTMNEQKKKFLAQTPLAELIRHPIHTRELGSHLTNVLRCLRLEAEGYEVSVTELVGWEHSMKNELIIAKKNSKTSSNVQKMQKARQTLMFMLETFHLQSLQERFS